MASRNASDPPVSLLPVAPVDRWLAPLSRFLQIEAASGIVLPSCTAVALALANSPLAAWFASVWKTPVSLSLRVTELPAGVTWRMLVGGACLAGIGFTMALFLNTLAFPVDRCAVLESAGKVGTLAGSVASAVIGAAVLTRALAR